MQKPNKQSHNFYSSKNKLVSNFFSIKFKNNLRKNEAEKSRKIKNSHSQSKIFWFLQKKCSSASSTFFLS